MATFFYRAGLQRFLEQELAWEGARAYRRISVRRRTWRTLWLVKRTYRLKVPVIQVRLTPTAYSERAPVRGGKLVE